MTNRLLTTLFVLALGAAPASAQSFNEEEATGDAAEETLSEDTQEAVTPDDEDDAEAESQEALEEAERKTEAAAKEVQEAVVPTQGERAKNQPGGVNLTVGLGVANFNGEIANNITPGPSWDLRGSFLTDKWVGGELAYEGALHGVEDNDADLGPDVDGSAVTSGGDAMARFNATTDSMAQPYAAVGLGYLGFDVRDENTTVDKGSTLTVPFSAGVDFYMGKRLIVGGRFNYRILTDVVDNDLPSGDQWNAGVNVGATF